MASMLRGNDTIKELVFRNNKITDDGARAIAAVLADRSALKHVDLRNNMISGIGIKALADSLERSERVCQVFVHPGGKIEAFSSSEKDSESSALVITSICIVDVRDNTSDNHNGVRTKGAARMTFVQTRRQSNNEAKACVKAKQSLSQSPSQKQRSMKSSTYPLSRPSSDRSAESNTSSNDRKYDFPKQIKKSPFAKN